MELLRRMLLLLVARRLNVNTQWLLLLRRGGGLRPPNEMLRILMRECGWRRDQGVGGLA